MQRPGPTSQLQPKMLALPGAVSRKSVGRSLDYWVSWLSQDTQGPYIRLRRALLSQDLPKHIVHHFACDCMEHTMSLYQHTGPALPAQIWDSFEAKRLWIEGHLGWDDLHQDILIPTLDLLDEIKEFHASHLLQMIKGSLRRDAKSAALSSVYHPIFPQDRHWQCQRLLSHLLTLRSQWERLIALLDFRHHTLAPHAQHWHQTLEDVLFG